MLPSAAHICKLGSAGVFHVCPALTPRARSLPACLSAASDQFAALDIKSIQHDSMTCHWLLPLLGGGGGLAAATGDAELRR
jgi:hypothetical protein